ncbi:MAG: hypothetical protein IT205_07470 [Fimbriimonadaceae bacterium]|nr:hypothetical protein [Fimbriimonadaceae bacterium]
MLVIAIVLFVLFILGIVVFIAANAGRGQEDWNSFMVDEPSKDETDPADS